MRQQWGPTNEWRKTKERRWFLCSRVRCAHDAALHRQRFHYVPSIDDAMHVPATAAIGPANKMMGVLYWERTLEHYFIHYQRFATIASNLMALANWRKCCTGSSQVKYKSKCTMIYFDNVLVNSFVVSFNISQIGIVTKRMTNTVTNNW